MPTERIETALTGYLYLAVADDLLKIGISSNPERRKRQLETATGRSVSKFASFRVYGPAACERYLHRRWKFLRCHGEWFSCGPKLFDVLAKYLQSRQVSLDFSLD